MAFIFGKLWTLWETYCSRILFLNLSNFMLWFEKVDALVVFVSWSVLLWLVCPWPLSLRYSPTSTSIWVLAPSYQGRGGAFVPLKLRGLPVERTLRRSSSLKEFQFLFCIYYNLVNFFLNIYELRLIYVLSCDFKSIKNKISQILFVCFQSL